MLLAQQQGIARGGGGLGLRRQRARIVIQCAQRIGHILEGLQHGLLVLRARLVVGGHGRAPLCAQLAAMKNRLQQAGTEAPHRIGRIEGATGRQCLRAIAAGQGELREHRGGRHANPGASLVQQGFGRQDVGALPHQRGGQADRQRLRQGEIGQPE